MAPIGETKAAHYVDTHLDQLLRVKKLTEAKVPLERIRQVMDGEAEAPPTSTRKPGSMEVKTHLHVMPGVEIQISAEEAGMSPEQIRMLLNKFRQAVVEALRTPEASHRLKATDQIVIGSTAEQAVAKVNKDFAKWGTVARKIGLSLD